MNILNKISALLAQFAEAAVAAAVEEGVELAGKVAKDVEDSFEHLVERLGGKATELVTALFNDDSLKGVEKANLAATQLAEHAAEQGIEIAAHHISALVQNAYLAVKAQIAKL